MGRCIVPALTTLHVQTPCTPGTLPAAVTCPAGIAKRTPARLKTPKLVLRNIACSSPMLDWTPPHSPSRRPYFRQIEPSKIDALSLESDAWRCPLIYTFANCKFLRRLPIHLASGYPAGGDGNQRGDGDAGTFARDSPTMLALFDTVVGVDRTRWAGLRFVLHS